MKKILACLLAVLLVAAMAACAASSPADTSSAGTAAPDAASSSAPAASSGAKLRFVTGGESGTYYAFGSVIAQHATNNAGVDVVGLVGNGSQSNIFELEDNNAELAFCQSDVMAYAYAGTNLFAETGAVDCFSTVAASRCRSLPQIPTSRPLRISRAKTSPSARPAPAYILTPWMFSASMD